MRIDAILPALVIFGVPAFADINADDVWVNSTAYYAATGGVLTATRERDGNRVFVEDIQLTYTLPFDAGVLSAAMPPMTMVEQDDGTVLQLLPKTFNMVFKASSELIDIVDLSASVSITQGGFSGIASGTPGDVTYTRSADAISMTLKNLMLGDELDDLTFDMLIQGEGYTSVNRVTQGELITSESEATTFPLTMEFESNDIYGARTVGTATYGKAKTANKFAIPASGVDITNLTPAFAAGMYFETATTTDSVVDETTTYLNEEIFSRDASRTGLTNSIVRVSKDGLSILGSSQDIFASFMDSFVFNEDVEVEISQVSGQFTIPIMAATNAQSTLIQLRLEDITLNDSTWNFIDADGLLPRDAANVAIDLAADIIAGFDLVDFVGLERAFMGGEIPIELINMRIDEFDIDAAGAAVTADGKFTFDNSDLDTFDGLPRPEGAATINMVGANALLDNLVALGLISESDAGLARLSTGMIMQANGDDQLTTSVEINDEGHVFANGERLR